MMRTSQAAEPVTIHLDPAARAELDELARASSRDLSAVATEAVTAYLEVNRGQVACIKEGLRQANAGEFATDAEVKAAFAAF